jgi:homoserine kinase
MRLTARVPATSANVGAGFDAFGLALDLCNEVTIETDVEPSVTWAGEGADELPVDGTDLVSSTIRRVAEQIGRDALPSFALHGSNRIPVERGLGSSSAAIVAGVALAFRLSNVFHARDRSSVFEVSAAIEGHPDNVAAATFGGFTIVAGGAVERFDAHRDLQPVVLVPDHVRVSTEEARRSLASSVPFEDAVYNASHAALTATAIVHRPASLFAAIGDRLHEARRLALVPDVARMFERLRAAGVPVCVSGSGPALLAFELEGVEVADPGDGWRILRLPVRPAGVEIVEG